MQFLNPALLAGALLFAVPLAIHLLNRQRHKRRPWAAMDFLLRAYQKQRRRLRNENLLLLLLRCLLPIVLALAVARPLFETAGLVATSGTVHHVLLLDASYSMGLRQNDGTSPFERGRALIGRLLDRFEQNPNRTDKVTLVTAGTRPRFLVRSDLDVAAARGAWLQLQKPEDAAGDLADALVQIADAIEADGERGADARIRVYVFTDLQARALGDALTTADAERGPELTDTLRDTAERIQTRADAELHWIDVGPFAATGEGGLADNVQITSLRLVDPAAVQRAAVEVLATVQNRGLVAATCEVTLDVDGGEPARKLLTVPPGGQAEADFQLTFREPGRRRVRASLVADGLAADDERFLTVVVRDRIRVLLVDGEASGDPLTSYGYVFQALLDPDPNVLPTFAVEVADLVALLGGQLAPQDHDVIVLADVERLNTRATEQLLLALRAGRGVLFAFGERSERDSFNLHLHAAGDGPMPFRLLETRGSAAKSGTARTAVITAPEHPLLAEFDEPVYREILQAIPVWRWHAVAGPLGEGTSVVLALTDAEQSPLLVTRPFGEGKAVFLTSPLASEYRPERWNHLDNPLVAFPLLHGLVKWLSLPQQDPFAALVGGDLSCSVPARPETIEVLRPERDGRQKTLLAEEAQPLPGGRYALPTAVQTTHAGFYVFELVLDRDNGKESLSLPFAVNVDPAEGELRYASHVELRGAVGAERVLTALPVEAEAADDAGGDDLGPSLLLATLLLVLGEAALARFVAVRRS